ncbi:MAG TPA: TatD family hydrolase [Bacteroidia bacterium]|nr:TatD family hydrolase [Bacteroidia bacterium]HRC33091.1 TatD family hydrolase [Bacteroidia bacterium]
MIITDTHIHLYSKEFDTDRDELVKTAMDKGVQRFFLPNIDFDSVDPMFALTHKYPQNCFAMLGLHPCYITANCTDQLTQMEKLIDAHRKEIYAIGEIGLDFYWDTTYVKEQEVAFIKQIHWASELNLPIAIHSRNATDEIIAILQQHHHLNLRGVFHCYSGQPSQAQQIIDMGFYLGIGGVVTFKKAGLDVDMQTIDLKHVILETDGPYLAPTPYRGKRNEPSYIVMVVQRIAEIKNISVEEVAQITTENSRQLFGI